MLLAYLAVLAGATVQAAAGFGMALIAGPALVAVLAPVEAVTTMLVLATTTTLLLLLVRPGSRPAVRWADVRVVVPAAVPGVLAGVLVLAVVSKAALQLAVGVGVLVAVAIQVLRRPVPGRARPSRWATLGVGLLAGVLTTTTNTNGPPLVLWLERRRVPPAEMRDTLAAMFLALNLLGAAVLIASGRAAQALRPEVVLVLLAAAVVGHVAGRRLFHLLDVRRFRVAGLTLSALAGVSSIVAGLG
ncbi:TSUP family transporter [Geodermatophilus sp. URMC 61]|uniref:TSUP family transporter n=1 Tax=Geodermatophilus sp. URMC 61 TaxID=3423411 RepID=UPI00406C12A8